MTDQVTLEGPLEKGVYTVDVVLGKHTSSASIIVADEGKKKKPAPLDLEFSPKLVTSSPGRGKNLLLRAPLTFADVAVQIKSEGVEVDSLPESVTLVTEPDGQWAESIVHVKTGKMSGELKLTATAGDSIAIGTLRIEEAGAKRGAAPRLAFELNGDKDPIDRYYLEKNGAGSFTVFVYGKHPLFNNVFGPYKDDTKGFANENTPEARAILSQVISHAFAQYLVELAYEKKPEEVWDAASTMFLFNDFVEKFVGKLHKALLK
jgi:hypothetical protein